MQLRVSIFPDLSGHELASDIAYVSCVTAIGICHVAVDGAIIHVSVLHVFGVGASVLDQCCNGTLPSAERLRVLLGEIISIDELNLVA